MSVLDELRKENPHLEKNLEDSGGSVIWIALK